MIRDEGAAPQIVRSDAAHEGARGAGLGGRHDLSLDQRSDAGDSGDVTDLFRNRVEVAERAARGIDAEMTVEAEDAAEQIGAKAVHDRHDDDQGGNPEGDPK